MRASKSSTIVIRFHKKLCETKFVSSCNEYIEKWQSQAIGSLFLLIGEIYNAPGNLN